MPWTESAAELERARAEQPFVVDAPRGRLVGLFTPPAPDAPPAGLCVIHLTRPRSHRNRMWVEGARHLAVRGFATVRFDYHGCGDSGGDSAVLDPNQPYRDDIVAVIRHAREHLGQRRFVLYGSCFDARTALSAFPEEGDAIEALVFVAAPVMELTTVVKAHADVKDWAHMWRALFRSDNWRALRERGRWRYMSTVLGRVARRSVGGPADELPLSTGFVEDFHALVRSRARALFLYGAEDAEYMSFQVAERRLLRALPPEVRARFEVEVWPGVVHGFLEMERQREAFARLLHWMESLHPAAADPRPGAAAVPRQDA